MEDKDLSQQELEINEVNETNVSENVAEEVVVEPQEAEECEQPQPEEAPANNEEKKRSFFLNRWVAKLAKWFDGGVFKLIGDDKTSDSSSLCIWALWIGVISGAIIAVVEMFNEHSTFPSLVATIGSGIILIMVALKAVKDAKKLTTGAQIAGRVAYLILVPFALAMIGGIIAAIAVVIVAIGLFLWLLFTLLFGTNEKVRLSNNDVVSDNGLLGGYRGKWGRKYSKNLDGTFTPED